VCGVLSVVFFFVGVSYNLAVGGGGGGGLRKQVSWSF
jgi:hypothetical protein